MLGPLAAWLRSPAALSVAFDTFLLQMSGLASVCAFFTFFRGHTQTRDQLGLQRTRMEVAQSLRALSTQASESVRRVLHDDVIHALLAVAGVRPGQADEVRDACDLAIDSVDLLDAQTTTVAAGPEGWLDFAERARAGLLLDITMSVDADDARTPAPVIDAILRATREALRNVARHSGVEQAVVTVFADSAGVTVSIHDDGRGFVVGRHLGYGLPKSLLAPMQRVGGDARIDSEPGHGTTVWLSWQAPTEPSPGAETDVLSRGGRNAFRLICYSVLASNTLLAIHVYATTNPRPASIVCTVLLFLASLVVIERIARNRMSRGETAVWGAALMIGGAISLAVAGPGAASGYESLNVGLTTVPLMAIAFITPLRHLWLLIAPFTLMVLVVILFDPVIGPQDAIGCFNATILPQVVLGCAGAAVRRSQRLLEEQHHEIIEATRKAFAPSYLERARRRHLTHTVEEIVPWLRGITSGVVRLDDSETHTTAGLLSLEARDDL